MQSKRIAPLVAALALAAPASARAAALPNPQTVALAAAYSYAGTVCDGQTPAIEWDPTASVAAVAWVVGINGQNCDPPVIHLLAPYWHDGDESYLAARAWPQYCTAIIHEYIHFTDLNWGGQSEVADDTSVENNGPWSALEEPSQCGHGDELWVHQRGHWTANVYVPSYSALVLSAAR